MKKIINLCTVFAFLFVFSAALFAAEGTVQFNLTADINADENYDLMGIPFSAAIYFDGNSPYNGGTTADCGTDENGFGELTIEEGVHTFVIAKFISSHTYYVSEEFSITVVAGETVYFEKTIAPYVSSFVAYYDAGWGNALYITGETDYLGNWQTAYKMTYNETDGAWRYSDNLPRTLEYKVVFAPWVDGDSISTSNVNWEVGDNRKVGPGSNSLYPTFE